jgi:hypothetical protein
LQASGVVEVGPTSSIPELKETEHRETQMNFSRVRLMAYSVLGAGLAVSALLFENGFDFPLLLSGTLFVLLILFDVGYHSSRGESQPCPHCGHPREHRSLRLSRSCPNCGK